MVAYLSWSLVKFFHRVLIDSEINSPRNFLGVTFQTCLWGVGYMYIFCCEWIEIFISAETIIYCVYFKTPLVLQLLGLGIGKVQAASFSGWALPWLEESTHADAGRVEGSSPLMCIRKIHTTCSPAFSVVK